MQRAAALSGRILMTAGLVPALMVSASQASQKVKVDLVPTAAAPQAKGRAMLSLRRTSDGRFDVSGQRLEGAAEYELIVGGVKVATLLSNQNGRVRARFSTRPRGRDMLLGFDPRGAAIAIRRVGDDDALGGSLPSDDSGNDGDLTCCLPDGGGDGDAECEDRTAEECAAQGGTVVGAGSCLPNPCGTVPPVGTDIVCCIPDDSGPECEDRTQAECLAQGGTVVQATSCAPNPCAATPPVNADIQCCLPDNGGDGVAECEDRTSEQCAVLGGVDMGPGTCTPNPCEGVIPPPGGGTGTAQVTCERRSGRSKVSVDGSNLAAGTYTARITSGANTATAAPLPTVGDQVEFDFDSDSGDIAAGATPIAASFIAGNPPEVTGEILDGLGAVVATSTATCLDR